MESTYNWMVLFSTEVIWQKVGVWAKILRFWPTRLSSNLCWHLLLSSAFIENLSHWEYIKREQTDFECYKSILNHQNPKKSLEITKFVCSPFGKRRKEDASSVTVKTNHRHLVTIHMNVDLYIERSKTKKADDALFIPTPAIERFTKVY